jgi:16S rRNA (uracil1498-N3)-methyltransferase
MRVLIQRGGCPPGGWEAGKQVRLEEDEVHHLRVRRARDREVVEILDGAGLRGSGRLIQSAKRWAVEIQSVKREERPAELTLAVAAGDRERFSWMVEKAAELGVTRIVPLETARIGGVASRMKEAHLERLRRGASEAIKQCGAAWAPVVEELVSLEDFARRPLLGEGWLADIGGAAPPVGLDRTPVSAVVGPEGGLTDAERRSLTDGGYRPVALGGHTLRFETAALAAAAAVAQGRMRGLHG